MASVGVRIRWDPKAIRELRTDPQVMRTTMEAAQGLGREMSAGAPKDTGAGAASIEARAAKRAAGAVDVGWDAAHFYLIFPEYGTKFIDEQRFARDALDRYNFF